MTDWPTESPWKSNTPLNSCKAGHERFSMYSGVGLSQAGARLAKGEAKTACQLLPYPQAMEEGAVPERAPTRAETTAVRATIVMMF